MKKASKVDDLMDKTFFKLSPETTVPVAVKSLGEKRVFGAIVADKSGHVLGILSEKECLKVYAQVINGKLTKDELNDMKVTEIMYPEFKTISRNHGLIEAAQAFLEVAYRRLPVLERGELVGQITRRDLVKGIEKFIE
jgi:predicted transcriptional regulator